MTALLNEALPRGYVAVRGVGARLREERGQDLIEYAVLSGVVGAAIAGVAALALTGALGTFFDNVEACVSGDTANCFQG